MNIYPNNDRYMANGMRDTSGTPLTDDEIQFVLKEIERIEADPDIFIFNDPGHLSASTCYNFAEDRIYVSRNVFPDEKYSTTHPRDKLSVAAVLAHEYYGHRPFRDEYLYDEKMGEDYFTTPRWRDEFRASSSAAEFAPNLTDRERADLINDALSRAAEKGIVIELGDNLKRILYGHSHHEKPVSFPFECAKRNNNSIDDFER